MQVRSAENGGRQPSLRTVVSPRWFHWPRSRLRLLDGIFTTVLAALLVFTPFAMGSVHAWAFTLIEVAVFGLLILWALRVTADPNGFAKPISKSPSVRSRSFLPPAAILGALVMLQLLPLPPTLVRLLSPNTYQFYVHALPGWPQTEPYSKIHSSTHATSGVAADSVGMIRHPIQARAGSPEPSTNLATESRNSPVVAGEASSNDKGKGRTDRSLRTSLGFAENWYPLAIAPSLTETALLKYAGYMGLFFLVLTYPFVGGTEGDRNFYRTIVATVVVTGVLVALVGLAERMYWNGKILWLFVPQDWAGPATVGEFPRATGPFVDPDHFGNYLSMTFPLALAGGLLGLSSRSVQRANVFRLLYGMAAFVIFLAIVLSLSRAAWIGATTAGLLFSLVCFNSWFSGALIQSNISEPFRRASRVDREPLEAYPLKAASQRLLARFSKTAALGVALFFLLGFVIFALFIIGPAGRTQADLRVGDSISDVSLGIRATVWKDTVHMIRDFPVFGVGLGGWPEVYRRYESPPFLYNYIREAHNDYLQYAAECGVVGILAIVWFVSMIAEEGYGALPRFSATERPLFIALGLAVVVMAGHELVDFCFRIPANAFLLTILFAVAVRMAVTKTQGQQRRGIRSPLTAGCTVVLSAFLIVFALRQKGLSYPSDVEQPSSYTQARAQMLAHPASVEAHLDVLHLAGQTLSSTDRLAGIEAAVFVDPTNPYVRDLYAQSLARAGRRTAALQQVAQSVYNSPTLASHFYLTKNAAALSSVEQNAVEQGFQEAVAARLPDAVDGYGALDEVFRKFSAEGQLYSNAARDAASDEERAKYFVAAGEAEVRAGNSDSAKNLFRRAIQAVPSDQSAYQNLISHIYGPARNLHEAELVTDEGIRNGADPLHLYLALSAAAQSDGDETIAEGALLRALAYQPTFEMYMQAGRYYLQNQKLDRAVLMFLRATEIDPASADGFYSLALAQESNYQYYEAKKNYARAANLSPEQFRDAYMAFRHRVDAAGSSR